MKRALKRRSISPGLTYSTRTVKGKNRLKNSFKKLVICIIIVTLVIIVKNMNFTIARKTTDGIKYLVTSEFNFKGKLQSLKGIVPAFRENFQKNFKGHTSTMIMPVDGPIVSGYGMRIHPVFNTERKHEGIDIDAEIGDPVKAVLDGNIDEVRQDDYFGNVIMIDHGNQLKTVYAHLGEVKVKVDQQVNQGEIIGLVGNTGVTTGSHLHFEVRRNDKAVDPVNELETNVRGK